MAPSEPHTIGLSLYSVSIESLLCSDGNIAICLPQSHFYFLIDNREKNWLQKLEKHTHTKCVHMT